MKYLWTPYRPKTNDHPLLENITPAKTRHIRGYGFGVTFSSCCFIWKHSVSYPDLHVLRFTEPAIVTQSIIK